ncbi:MAG: hypothetical protein PHH60_02180, partial [Candidatus Margulisbacteria bacterium]|nr:hypothetical protein [Candidatus Margulisiibacteriota bacterium]
MTDFYAGRGLANRRILAHNLQHLNVGEQDRLLDLLVQRGILKGRFRADLASLDQVEEFMLSGRVTAAKFNALSDGLQEIFPGTAEIITNLSYGIFQAQESFLTRALASQAGSISLNLALGLGVASAGVIGATLLGIPATYLLGAGTVYSVISATLLNRVNPHSWAGKICKFGSMLLPFVLTANLLVGSYVTFKSGFMFIDAMQKYLGYAAIGGLAIGGLATLAISARDIFRTWRSNMGYLRPLGKWHIAKNMLLANTKVFSGINYLSYRILLFSAFAIGAGVFHFSGASTLALAGLGIGAAARFGLPLLSRYVPKLRRERMTEWVADKAAAAVDWVNSKTVTLADGRELQISGKKGSDNLIVIEVNNGQKLLSFKVDLKDGKAPTRKEELATLLKKIGEDNNLKADYTPEVEKAVRTVYKRAQRLHFHPLDKMVIEYFAGMLLKYGALLAATLPFVDSPLALFFDLATVYTGAWTIFADFHSGHSSILSALNWKRSMNNPEDLLISDADRRNTSQFCARMIAYVNDVQRNFSKIVNMLLMEYPHMEVEFCGELNPYGGLGAIRQLRSARASHLLIKQWRDQLYLRFHAFHLKLQALDPKDPQYANRVTQAARELAKLLTELGDRYTKLDNPDPANPVNFVPFLRKLVADDASRPKDDWWFNLTGEDPFVRQGYEAIRVRGLKFYEMARDFEEMARLGFAKHEDLAFFTKELLGIFSVAFNHAQRRLESLDDKCNMKTDNLAWTETHVGDTLYQVWRLVVTGKDTYAFRPEFIPSTYVRVKNPNYNHLPGNAAENQKYLWIRREDWLEVLGLSQAMSNDYQLVNNTPGNIGDIEQPIDIKAGHHELRVRGFYCDLEVLPPGHLVDWEGNTVPPSDLVWVAGAAMPPAFDRKFKTWASGQYGKDYADWIEKQGPGALWFIDEPEVLALAANENYNVCDEAYIVINTERELSAEINHTAKKDKIIRVVNYDRWQASFPNPDPSRKVEWVKSWRRQDAFIGLRYETTDGQKFNLPYPENRTTFIQGTAGETWMQASYGLIKGKVIEVYSKDGRKLGTVSTEWPHHMHPAEKIKDGRIEIDVFPERVGKGTWLVADYGDNCYDPKDKNPSQPYNRYRFAFLDFDTEAKQEFWPNFIEKIEQSRGGKRLTFTTLSTNCESFPFDKKWAGVSMADEAEVLSVDTSGKIYFDPRNRSWSPVKDADHTHEIKGTLLLMRDSNGAERVVPLTNLPGSLSTLPEVRKVINIEEQNGKLVFTKLRRKDPIKDRTEFIYSLRPGLLEDESQPEYKQLKWLLDKQDL